MVDNVTSKSCRKVCRKPNELFPYFVYRTDLLLVKQPGSQTGANLSMLKKKESENYCVARAIIRKHGSRILTSSVADPHHCEADPDPAFHLDAALDLSFYSNADPDPTNHFSQDFDPSMIQNDL